MLQMMLTRSAMTRRKSPSTCCVTAKSWAMFHELPSYISFYKPLVDFRVEKRMIAIDVSALDQLMRSGVNKIIGWILLR